MSSNTSKTLEDNLTKVFAVFPDDYRQSMSVHPMIKPADKLQSLNVRCLEQKEFFSNAIKEVNQDDIVIIWIGIKDDKNIEMFSNLRCRKYLRNVDSCTSDRILFRKELDLFKKIDFDAILVTYCTNNNLKFLSDRGIRSIKYPHLMDFSNCNQYYQKSFDVFISGQLSENSYPMRTRLAKLFTSLTKNFQVGFLPHPGHKLKEVRHQFFGDKYVELASQSRTGVVCTGDDDSLVMKYLEFAKSCTLPIGDAPSNMPEDARSEMIITHHSMTDAEIVQNLEQALKDPESLRLRSFKYQEVIKNSFDISKTSLILDKIIKGTYDS